MRVDDRLEEQIGIKNGCLELSDTPGSGIEISAKKLEKYKKP